jgi:cytochrome c oxidase assembly factor CtaG/cytochrome c2
MWLLRLKLAIATALSYCSAAHLRAAPDAGLHWPLDPLVLALIAFPAFLYAVGLYRLTRRDASGPPPDRLQVAAFAAGMSLVFIALCSPVESLADTLFSMHMAQHILLMMAAPPLLVWARPGPVFWAALTPLWQERIATFWERTYLDRLFACLIHPVTVFILFCGAFVFWHLPRPYLWGLSYEAAHFLEHASFLLTALAFWTIVIEPSGERRLGYAATLIYLTVIVVLSDMPGALMVISPRLLYPIHEAGAAAWGLTPMQDQQLAGLIMWIPAGAVYLGAAIWLFVRLLQASERRSIGLRRAAPAATAVLLLPLLLVGCGAASSPTQTIAGGDPDRGSALIGQFGCGACHVIPGIEGARGHVGPPLDQVGERVYLAGVLRNTPDNMIAWLRAPQSIVPGNAMPDMGLDEKQARDIAAYLYTLN